jgi:alginate O-acetyltransferase complex protein AlgI
MSYLIDVYRGETVVQRNLMQLTLYICLFPQLIAGPIIRYHDISDQLLQRSVDWTRFASGTSRFILGLGKKMVLANAVSGPADKIFGLPVNELTCSLAWFGTLCYFLQIYLDFSAYSDMAIGLGRMFGFEFLENFDYPYISRSITEFWRRWHISLSRWYRDYLYIPLGGNRFGPARTYFNLAIVFFLCGLWHGASWAFVAWGLYHGAFLIIERMGLSEWLKRWPVWLQHVYTLAVVLVGWVFFRADTLSQGIGILGAMMGLAAGDPQVLPLSQYLDLEVVAGFAAGILASVPVIPWCSRLLERLENSSRVVEFGGSVLRVAMLLMVLVYSTLLMAGGAYSPFIYFRF